MNDYKLGDVVGDDILNELYELRHRKQMALHVAFEYGQIDGGHHKAWVIDRMVRALTGEHYAEWVRAACRGEDGPNTYAWDEGVAP